jgi:hypothetical protein
MASMPAFAAAYAEEFSNVVVAATETMLMMTPALRFTIAGRTDFVHKNVPRKFVARIVSKSRTAVFPNDLKHVTPALFTRTSTT